MPTLDLTPYYQPPASTSDGTKFDNALAAIQSTVNALDSNNITSLTQSKITFDNWTAYTPAWTSSGAAPVLNNGTAVGKYVQIGKTVIGRAVVTFGSTTTFGTGNYAFSLPVAALVGGLSIGTVLGSDAGVAVYVGFALLASTTTFNVYTPASPAATWTNTVPLTWGNGDSIAATFFYEAA